MRGRVQEVINEEGLRGFWPCNDGVGLTVRDLSKHRGYGFIKDCEWIEEDRPYPLKLPAELSEKEILQPFHPKVCLTATFYTNGEALVIAHPNHTFWGKENYGGVAQKFSLDTGMLTDEVEYTEFGTITSACFTRLIYYFCLLFFCFFCVCCVVFFLI